MTPTQEEQPRRPARAGPRTLLGWLAAAASLYPLLVCLALYGEWLFAWLLLGYAPRPMLDDPKYIPGLGLAHEITEILLLGFVPFAAVAALLQSAVAFRRREPPLKALTRLALVAVAWGAVIGLFIWDPGRVSEWWFD